MGSLQRFLAGSARRVATGGVLAPRVLRDDEVEALLSPGYALPSRCGTCDAPSYLDGTCRNGHDVVDERQAK